MRREVAEQTFREFISELNTENNENNKENVRFFTLVSFIGLVTHESFEESDETKNVLLLCHKCFSTSLQMLETVRSRFFIPPPSNIKVGSVEIDEWVDNVQRNIQLKCVYLLTDWIKYLTSSLLIFGSSGDFTSTSVVPIKENLSL